MKILVEVDVEKTKPVFYTSSIILLLKKIAADQQLQIVESTLKNVSKKLPENFLFILNIENNKSPVSRTVAGFQRFLFLKKIKFDIIISETESSSFQKSSIIILNEVSINDEKKLAKILQKSNAAITYSKEIKNKIEAVSIKNKTAIIYPSQQNFYKPATEELKIHIKEEFTNYKEFFIASMPRDEQSLMSVLKTFSAFKKWQQSNMKLLLFDFFNTDLSFATKKISSYKYKNDVVFYEVKNENQFAQILSSSFSFINFKNDEEGVCLAAKALQCCIPVISVANESIKEICGEAVLCVSENEQNISKLMIELYKNESLQNQMKVFAREQSVKLNIKTNAFELQQLINNVASNIHS